MDSSGLSAAALGLLVVGLVYAIAYRLFDPAVAFVAGLMAALFGPLVFYETQLLRSVLQTFLSLTSILLGTIAFTRSDARWFAATGVSAGLLFLAQSSSLLFIGVMALMVLLASSASEALGVHAFLGAFLIGAALGDTRDHHKDAHDVIGSFVTSFAPIFFISMGMSTNFIANFDALLVAIVLVAACLSKVGAVLLGAKAAGMPLDREVWAIGFGLNARGATGIILAGVGLTNGVIDARIFVAMVVMAATTSLIAGPMMSRLLDDAGARDSGLGARSSGQP